MPTNILQAGAEATCLSRRIFHACPIENILPTSTSTLVLRENAKICFVISEGMYVMLEGRSDKPFLITKIEADGITISGEGKVEKSKIVAPHHTWIDGFAVLDKLPYTE